MSYQHIFDIPTKPIIESVDQDLKKMEFKENRVKLEALKKNERLASKRKVTTYENCENNDYIDNKIKQQFEKSNWNTIDLHMKWKCIMSYLTRNEVELNPDQLNGLLMALKNKELTNVLYNKKEHEIEKLNYSIDCLDL